MTRKTARIVTSCGAILLIAGFVVISVIDEAALRMGSASIGENTRPAQEVALDTRENAGEETAENLVAPITPSNFIGEVIDPLPIRDFEPSVLQGFDVVVIDGPSGAKVTGAEVMAAYTTHELDGDTLFGFRRGDVPVGLDYEELLRCSSRRFLTDCDGRVRVPSKNLQFLGARSGNSFAFAKAHDSKGVLELRPDTRVDVDVVDASDRPVEGVQLVIEHFFQMRGYPWSQSSLLAVTNRDGRATLNNIDKFVSGDRVVQVCVATPGLKQVLPCPTVNPRDLPTTPIRLTLAEGDRLRVEVMDAAGRPYLDRACVGLRGYIMPPKDPAEVGRRRCGNSSWEGRWVGSLGEADLRGGVAHFPHVGSGCSWTAWLTVRGFTLPLVLLPIAPGLTGMRENVLRFQCSDLDELLVIRLVDPRGVPLVNWDVEAVGGVPLGRPGPLRGCTDANGVTAIWTCGVANWYERKEGLNFGVSAVKDNIMLFGSLDLKSAKSERGDVIDIHMNEGDLLARGVVRDDRGQPCAGVCVQLKRISGEDYSIDWYDFRSVGYWETDTGLDGSFAVRCVKPQGTWGASIEGAGLTPSPPVEFTPGQTLELKATRIGIVNGKIICGSAPPHVACRVEVGVTPIAGIADTVPKVLEPTVAEDGSFTVEVPAGVAHLKVFAINDYVTPLAEIYSILVGPGEVPQDPRLATIDVTPMLCVVRLDVRSANGTEHDSACWRVVEGHWTPVFSMLTPPQSPIYLSTAPVDLVVFAEWTQLAVLLGVHADTSVMLRPNLEVLISAEAAPAIPSDLGRVSLCVEHEVDLQPLKREGNHPTLLYDPGSDGIYQVIMRGPGKLKVEWAIWDRYDKFIGKLPSSLRTFDVPQAEAALAIHMPPPNAEALRRLVESLSK